MMNEDETSETMSDADPRDIIDVSPAAATAEARVEERVEPPPAGAEASGDAVTPLTDEEVARFTDAIIAAIKTVYDPEIPVNIFDLGLIYHAEISDARDVTVDMTLTAPGCPVAGEMPGWVEEAVSKVEGVRSVRVNMVFDPPWDMSRMSDEARLELGMF